MHFGGSTGLAMYYCMSWALATYYRDFNPRFIR